MSASGALGEVTDGPHELGGSNLFVSDFWRRSGNNIVSRQRTPDTLERKLSNRLDCDGVFDLRQHTRTNQEICPGFASSHSREATLDTVPIAA
jgi:hypothetical protein